MVELQGQDQESTNIKLSDQVKLFECSGATNMWDHLVYLSKKRSPSFSCQTKRKFKNVDVNSLNDSLKILKLDDVQPPAQNDRSDGLKVQVAVALQPDQIRGQKDAEVRARNAVDTESQDTCHQNELDEHPDDQVQASFDVNAATAGNSVSVSTKNLTDKPSCQTAGRLLSNGKSSNMRASVRGLKLSLEGDDGYPAKQLKTENMADAKTKTKPNPST